MPLPIVPAPITVTFSTGRDATSVPRFAALFSAKNRCRSADDCEDVRNFSKCSRATRMPASNGCVTEASTLATIAFTASSGRCLAGTLASAAVLAAG